jgi:hypothetical protein
MHIVICTTLTFSLHIKGLVKHIGTQGLKSQLFLFFVILPHGWLALTKVKLESFCITYKTCIGTRNWISIIEYALLSRSKVNLRIRKRLWDNFISLKKKKSLGEDNSPLGIPLSLFFQTHLKIVTGPYMPTCYKDRIVLKFTLLD